ncbi:beta-propeller domain-containing protein, partial [Candidatus Uhrbacteria bacterium]|nr:beta-propeller domain-containing protein [Candidatus Uhrbacteria bacterium]
MTRRIFAVILLVSMLVPTIPLAAATPFASADVSIARKIWNVLRGIPKILTPKKKKKVMVQFASAKEFDRYVADLIAKQKKQQKIRGTQKGLLFGSLGFNNIATESSLSSPVNDSITNVQEQGVDEGDIVKAYKDYLVILRRGRLFVVKTTDAGKPTLTSVARANAYPDGMTPASWYDELLIDGNRVIVIGYSYQKSATEIGLFRLADNGTLTHEGTYFLDSNDYYSSRNYASRLVDGKLVFYMPYYFLRNYYGQDDRADVHLPAMKKWIAKDETEERSILSKVDIYKPLQEDLSPALHTVVMCDLKGELDCRAKAVLGPSSRNFYVSPNAVYLWMTESTPRHTVIVEESDMKCLGGILGIKCSGTHPKPEPNAYVYRIDLRDGAATVLRADGSPIDQFSFKEADGYLNVLVRSEGRGDWMWHSETTTGDLALFRTPLT